MSNTQLLVSTLQACSSPVSHQSSHPNRCHHFQFLSVSLKFSVFGFIKISLLIRIDSRDKILVVASFALRDVKLLVIQVKNLFSVLNLESYF